MCNFDGIFGHWRRKRNRKNAAAEQERQRRLQEEQEALIKNDPDANIETADRVTESSSDRKKKNTISSLRLPTVNTGSTNNTGLNIG